jgi:hypothetical protein
MQVDSAREADRRGDLVHGRGRRRPRVRRALLAALIAGLFVALALDSEAPAFPGEHTAAAAATSQWKPNVHWHPHHDRCPRARPHRHRHHRPAALPLAVDVGLGRAGLPVRITVTLPGRFTGKVVFSEHGRRIGKVRTRGHRRVVLTTSGFGAGRHTVAAWFKAKHRRCRLRGAISFYLAPGQSGTVDVQYIRVRVPVGTIAVSIDLVWVGPRGDQVWVPSRSCRDDAGWSADLVVTDTREGTHPWAATIEPDAGPAQTVVSSKAGRGTTAYDGVLASEADGCAVTLTIA